MDFEDDFWARVGGSGGSRRGIGRTGFAGEGSDHEHATARFSSPSSFRDRGVFILHASCLIFESLVLLTTSKPIRMHSQQLLPYSYANQNSHSPLHPSHPASVHFTLGFMGTDTIFFPHDSCDLTTPFRILLFATYLDLQSLYDETQVLIVQEMCHALVHGFLEFSDYENLTGGKWGTPVNHGFSGAAARRNCKYCCRQIRYVSSRCINTLARESLSRKQEDNTLTVRSHNRSVLKTQRLFIRC
jgi:hypothetical protein